MNGPSAWRSSGTRLELNDASESMVDFVSYMSIIRYSCSLSFPTPGRLSIKSNNLIKGFLLVRM